MNEQRKVSDAVLITLEIISSAVLIYTAWRALVGPDTQQRMVMRLANFGERQCHKNAVAWATYADKCNAVYKSATNVSV